MIDGDKDEIAALRAEVARLAAKQEAPPSPALHRRTAVYVIVAAMAALIFGAAYFGSPFLALHDLRQVARDGDRDRLEQLVDFPRVRENLKSKIDAYVLQSMRSDPNMANNPFAGLGALIVPAIADRAIDSYVTPDGIAAVVNNGSPPKLNAADAAEQSQTASSPLKVSPSFADLDHFKVALSRSDAPASTLSLVLERHGLFGWRLIRIDFNLPPSRPEAVPAPSPSQQLDQQSGANAMAPDIATAPEVPAPTAPPFSGAQFGAYGVEIYRGPLSYPDFAGAQRQFRAYRTMIRQGVDQGVQFGGHYAVVLFGCGTDCGTGYIEDVTTGKVFDLPVGGDANPDMNLDYKPNSFLLKAYWRSDLAYVGDQRANSDPDPTCDFEDFLWDGSQFRGLGEHKEAGLCPSEPQSS
jgi:Protein of unknown function (DUF2939)